MSSPMSPGAQEGESSAKKPVSFQFCAECSNMLYPREDAETRALLFVCRTCHYTTAAANTCVFRNELSSTASLHAGIIEGMGKDPTVGAAPAASLCSSSSSSLSPQDQQRHHRCTTDQQQQSAPASPSTVPSALAMCLICGIPVVCGVCKATPLYVPAPPDDPHSCGGTLTASSPSLPATPSSTTLAFDFSSVNIQDDSDMYDFLDETNDSGEGEEMEKSVTIDAQTVPA